jgi:predicted metalloprotease with PDZ domain
MRFLLSILSLCSAALAATGASADPFYNAEYVADFRPSDGVIGLELNLKGEDLPSRIRLRIDPKRHRSFRSTDPIDVQGSELTWRPQGKISRLKYEFVVNHERTTKGYDSFMNKDFALFRGDKLVPRARVTAKKGLAAKATIRFVLPKNWSIVTSYGPAATLSFPLEDPERRFDRPEGWMLAGKIGVRAEKIGHVQATIAAPVGESARRQDTLAFLNWNLPRLLEVFTDFPRRLLLVSAGDPMWRGGLSGPSSLFLHADRPLISENRTSTLLHELVHVAMALHADHESDWIVEGFAEYYSIETLRRSGGISDRRHAQALAEMTRWAGRSANLFASNSTGATTARAVLVFVSADREIRNLTQGKRSLDDVARALAKEGGEVSLARLQKIAAGVAGKRISSLERSQLAKMPTIAAQLEAHPFTDWISARAP